MKFDHVVETAIFNEQREIEIANSRQEGNETFDSVIDYRGFLSPVCLGCAGKTSMNATRLRVGCELGRCV